MINLIETLVVIFTTILIAMLFTLGIAVGTFFYTGYYVILAIKKQLTKPCGDR